MKALVVFDGRFYTNSNQPCSYHLTYELFTKRYLSEFDSVTIVGRLFEKEDLGAKPVVGHNALFCGIPGYVGPKEFFKTLPKTIKMLWNLDLKDTAVFLRTPGTIPFIFSLILLMKRKAFAVEVVADPFDQLSKGSVEHPTRRFFQRFYTSFLKWQCRKAIAASYVTRYSLQKRYPPKSKINTHYTSLNLGDEWFVPEPRKIIETPSTIKLLNIGMMSQLYKAQDVILEAVKILSERGQECHITFVGDGEYKQKLQDLALKLNIAGKTTFTGKIADRSLIKSTFDHADIFVLPSRQEGLPRAMIEAMSRALPCIGTRVGGIGELIDDECLIDVNSPVALADKIIALTHAPEKLSEQSIKNLKTSKEYKSSVVQTRREKFYRGVKELSL
jgi:glycosyltransferase involved in cell wall biosynthesis